jgi:two-component system sensor histidine kinase DctS
LQILFAGITATGLVLGAVVSERLRAEQRLREHQRELARAARLATAGALGAAVAHEISQPLAIMATYLHHCSALLDAKEADVAALARLISCLQQQVRGAGEVIARVRNVLVRREPRLARTDLVALTRDVVEALADDAQLAAVPIRLDVRPLPKAPADRIEFEIVLANLIRNAIEAAASRSDHDGSVLVRLRHDRGNVQIDVEDNGPGVSPDIADRLFEPLETSKPYGMGLGLALSRQIIEAHQGCLFWDKHFSGGARFVVRLPSNGTRIA